MSPGGQLPLPNRLYDLEAIQLGHVDVEEHQVKTPLFRQSKRLPAVAHQSNAMSLPND
jgi:hypothetical protein